MENRLRSHQVMSHAHAKRHHSNITGSSFALSTDAKFVSRENKKTVKLFFSATQKALSPPVVPYINLHLLSEGVCNSVW